MSCCRFILLKPPEHTEFAAALLFKPIQILPLVLQNMELNMKCPGQPASRYFYACMFATGALFTTESPPILPIPSHILIPSRGSCCRARPGNHAQMESKRKGATANPRLPHQLWAGICVHAAPKLSTPSGTPGCGVQDRAPAGRASLFAWEGSGDLYYVFSIL